jgi:hypothetical protein
MVIAYIAFAVFDTQERSATESLILRNTTHTGPVRGLDFNPIQSSLLASGAIGGEVRVVCIGSYNLSLAFLDFYLGSQRPQQTLFPNARSTDHQTRRDNVSGVESTSTVCSRRGQ